MSDDELHEYWRDVKAPPRERAYIGHRDMSTGKCRVRVEVGGKTKALPLCLSVMRHSPTGFEWGYSGSGPAQLALALLMDTLGRDQKDRALGLHQSFKAAIVTKLPQNEWKLTNRQVLDAVARLEGPGKGGDRGG